MYLYVIHVLNGGVGLVAESEIELGHLGFGRERVSDWENDKLGARDGIGSDPISRDAMTDVKQWKPRKFLKVLRFS